MTTRIGSIVSVAVGLVLAATAAFGVANVVGQSASEAQPVNQPLVTYGDATSS